MDEKALYNTILDAQEEIEKAHGGISLLQSERKLIAKAICVKFGTPKIEWPKELRSCKTCAGVGWWTEQFSDTEIGRRKCPDCEGGETELDYHINKMRTDCIAAYNAAKGE